MLSSFFLIAVAWVQHWLLWHGLSSCGIGLSSHRLSNWYDNIMTVMTAKHDRIMTNQNQDLSELWHDSILPFTVSSIVVNISWHFTRDFDILLNLAFKHKRAASSSLKILLTRELLLAFSVMLGDAQRNGGEWGGGRGRWEGGRGGVPFLLLMQAHKGEIFAHNNSPLFKYSSQILLHVNQNVGVYA